MTDPDSVLLGEAAYRQIRAEIVNCRLAPGSRLTERGLATETGFGVSPIRDALTRLDHEGLVRTLPRKGYQVKSLTIKIVDDLFDFWAIIGPEVIRHGVDGATDEQIERVIACGEELENLINTQTDPRLVAQRSCEIFDEMSAILSEATGNDYLINTYARLSGEIARVWTLVFDSELVEEGTHLLRLDSWQEDILERNGDKVAELARRYIAQSHNRILRMLARWPSVITTEVIPLPHVTTQ